jgi:hypothetical protein
MPIFILKFTVCLPKYVDKSHSRVLQSGSPDSPLFSGDSPLFKTVRIGNVKAMKFLVNNFEEIFCIHQLYLGSPLLYHAATERRLSQGVRREMCRFLVENGADPNQIIPDSHAPPYMAALLNDTEAALLYLECGADPNLNDGRGRTISYPIDNAIAGGYIATLSLLLLHAAVFHQGHSFYYLIDLIRKK